MIQIVFSLALLFLIINILFASNNYTLGYWRLFAINCIGAVSCLYCLVTVLHVHG